MATHLYLGDLLGRLVGNQLRVMLRFAQRLVLVTLITVDNINQFRCKHLLQSGNDEAYYRPSPHTFVIKQRVVAYAILALD